MKYRWVITAYEHTWHGAAYKVKVTTDKPIHLTLWWTHNQAYAMTRAKSVRGWMTLCDSKWPTPEWKPIEQNESGDTLTHTFGTYEWSFCERRWWLYAGTWMGIPTPITSIIFTAHYNTTKNIDGYITLKPDAPGDLCNLPFQVGSPCPNHWSNLIEYLPDEDASKVGGESTPGYGSIYDLYRLQPFPFEPAFPIVSIEIIYRCKADFPPSRTCAKPLIKTGGTVWNFGGLPEDPTYLSEDFATMVSTSWAPYAQHLNLNPNTGLPWTPTDLANLQIGIALRRATPIGVNRRVWCTWLNLVVAWRFK